MAEKKQAPKEQEILVLVSPGGHKYELTVSDSGNLSVNYKSKDVIEDDNPDA